jgi:nicotinate-nucleotide pyrophosphorylase (carboxylating)
LTDTEARDPAPLTHSLPDIEADARRVAEMALAEDGPRDVTTERLASATLPVQAAVQYRGGGVVAGTAYADAVALACDCSGPEWMALDGSAVAPGTMVGRLQGKLGAVLRAERPMLNLLQRACGIASLTRRYVEALAGLRCTVLHTRKTAPGLRGLDVRAVLAGGGAQHRVGLARELLFKDNHWAALARGGGALQDVLQAARDRGVESLYVEVESLEQLEAACAAGATRLLVDNQAPATLAMWAQAARDLEPEIELEASGGITLENVRAYAEAGADFVSVGALTHSVPAADVALEIVG